MSLISELAEAGKQISKFRGQPGFHSKFQDSPPSPKRLSQT